MPYLGLPSFLLKGLETIMNSLQVSMPYLGLPSFILQVMHGQKSKQKCQCPISGSLHFYNAYSFLIRFLVRRVNALSRAPFISTPPLKLLDFMRCSSLVFAHICQNILKYCYFIALFWFLTVWPHYSQFGHISAEAILLLQPQKSPSSTN